MKRVLSLIVSVLLLAALLAGCGSSSSDLSVKNSLDSVIHNVYVSPSDTDTWGDPVSFAKLSRGSTIQVDFSSIGKDAGPGIYDIGVIDENAMNFDVYEVELAAGDAIEITGNADGAVYTITHADGSADRYDAFIYSNDE